MPLILPGNVASATAATTYSVANSCRFNAADEPYLHYTPDAGDVDKWTMSMWIKRGRILSDLPVRLFSAVAGGGNTAIRFNADSDCLRFEEYQGGAIGYLVTNRDFRDPSAWYHLVFVWDSDNAAAGNRMRIYVNGTEETSFSTDNQPDQDQDSLLNSNIRLDIGRHESGNYMDGYMAEVIFCDGQAYAASDFGEFNSDSPTIWQPTDPSGLTFGTNGFWLDFEDSSALGNDVSGNNNDFTVVNLAAVDQCTDTPTNNFCTMNPLDNFYTAATFSEGNCRVSSGSASIVTWCTSTFGVSSGKWYWECKVISGLSLEQGFTDRPSPAANQQAEGATNTLAKRQDQIIYWNASVHATDWTAVSADDILMFALDLDNNKTWVGVNGTWEDSGDPTSGATGTGAISITAIASTTHGSYFVSQGHGGNSTAGDVSYNFGNPPHTISSGNADDNGYGNFEYDVPAGFLALCTKNLGSDGG